MDFFYYWLLIGTVLADSEVTAEEHELLINIIANLKEYSKILERASKDKIITPEEKE